MKGKRGISVLVVAVVAGLVAAFVAPEGFDVLFGLAVLNGSVGVAALGYAILVACKRVAPSPKLGRSQVGQAMQGIAALLMCALLLAGKSWSPVVGWSVGIGYFLLCVIGLRLEHKAREQPRAVEARQ